MSHRFASWMGPLLACALWSAQANAQTDLPPPDAPPGAVATPSYSAEQLDQLLAPIALYPDDLLGQILIAATYPLEIVQADRWLQNPYNASLRGSALAQALQELPWDTSVKSLVAYPQILSWMDSSLDWVESVGDAFLANQPAVMDSVQRLRARAQSAGALASTPQQTVTADGQDISIASPDSSVEYVPVYSPDAAYGPWPYPDYPPYDFSEPGYAFGTFIAFPVLVPYWGWDRWDWHRHRIYVDPGAGSGAGSVPPAGTAPPPRRVVPWRHDPSHRNGVPYRDPATRTKYEGRPDNRSIQSNYRGYPVPSQSAPPKHTPTVTAGAPTVAPPAPVAEVHRPAPTMPRPEAQQPTFAMPRTEARPAPPPMPRPQPAPVERSLPPAMESFGRGEDVHAQEQRGISSRASAPAPAHSSGGRR